MIIKEEDLEDFPVQFKEINYSDFPGYNHIDESKVIIKPDIKGYISDQLSSIVDLISEDTTIVNAGVGQGKTKAIIDFIKYYYDQTVNGSAKYKIVVVTPFKSLNTEYEEKIYQATALNDICFDYQELASPFGKNFEENFEKPIQLISVKSILGDAGDNAQDQNKTKKEYYKYLIENCISNDYKVIMFFDELHESLDAFKEILMPNLFKWKEAIHKIIVASATFSESSIVPLKFFGKLTRNNIKIIESERTAAKEISDLSIYFYNRPTYNFNDYYLHDIFSELLEKDFSVINILCSSKSNAIDLYNSDIGEKIKTKFPDLNLCVGGDDEQPFNKDISNIGTTFKTGVSITKEKSCYMIILPALYSNATGEMGVFTDRINSLVQSIARPRVKSEIIIITPPPSKLLVRKDDSEAYLNKMSLGFFKFDQEVNQSDFKSFSQQEQILKTRYKLRKEHISDEIEQLKNLQEDIITHYDSFDWFRLKEGDEYLNKNLECYGKNLANYLYWAAWNNQFVNCRLKSIVMKGALNFSEGSIQQGFDKNIPKVLINKNSFIHSSDKQIYKEVRDFLFKNNVYLNSTEIVDGISIPKRTKITSFRSPTFEQQLIHFIQRRKAPYLFEPQYGCSYSTLNGDSPIDIPTLTKEKYIRIAISQCLKNIEKAKNLNIQELFLINTYNDLFSFRQILLSEYTITTPKGETLLPLDSNFAFTNMQIIKLKTIFSNLIQHDLGFQIYGIKEIPSDKAIYSMIKKIFFNLVQATYNNKKYSKITKYHSFEYSEYSLNLIYHTVWPYLYFAIPPNLYNNVSAENNEEMDVEFIDLNEINPEEFKRTIE